MNPDDRRYTEDHEWAKLSSGDDGHRVTIGITHYAQEELGDIVYVDLPATGTAVEAGQPFGEVESTKSVSDLYAPVTGTIVERNATLESSPEVVKDDPYGEGWMVVIAVDSDDVLDELMSAEAYGQLTSDD